MMRRVLLRSALPSPMAISAAGHAAARVRRLRRFAALAAAGPLLAIMFAVAKLAAEFAFELEQFIGVVARILIAMLHRTALGRGRIHRRTSVVDWEPSVTGRQPNLPVRMKGCTANCNLRARIPHWPTGNYGRRTNCLHSAEISREQSKLLVADPDWKQNGRTKTVTSFHQNGETRPLMNHFGWD
jgi:hypothetical protein